VADGRQTLSFMRYVMKQKLFAWGDDFTRKTTC
jgi:hypothetical protein